MSDNKEIAYNDQQEIEAILEAIEGAESEEFRDLFKASQLRKDEFTNGMLGSTEEELDMLIGAMLKDDVIQRRLGKELKDWRKMSRPSRLSAFSQVYDILASEILETKTQHEQEKQHNVAYIIKKIIENSMSKKQTAVSHVCYKDAMGRRERYVQANSLELAKEIRNFYRDINENLNLTDAIQTIERSAYGAFENPSCRHKISLRCGILNLFKFIGIRKDAFDDLVRSEKTDSLEKLQNLLKQIQPKLLNKVGGNYNKEDFKNFIESLIGFILSRDKPFSGDDKTPKSKKYNAKDNIEEIILYVSGFKDRLLNYLHNTVEDAYNGIDKAVKVYC